MVKRNFAALLIVSTLVVSVNVRADQAFAGADGCAVLAQLVFAEVTAAAWDGAPLYSVSNGHAAGVDITVCNRTAQTVSEAFALAMSSIGTGFSWHFPTEDPGDHCWGGFLEQCYPRREPVGVEAAAWAAVSTTVRYAMPLGSASDKSVFSVRAMRKALRAALQADAKTK